MDLIISMFFIIALGGASLYLMYALTDKEEELEKEKHKRRYFYKEGVIDGLKTVLVESGSQEFDLYNETPVDGIDYGMIERLFY